jgi:hypothetical protein
MNDRAGIFDNSADFDVAGFAPKQPKPQEKKIPVETVRAISEAANFPSREAVAIAHPVPAAEILREQRRYRTGRNVQLNIKVKTETLDAFYHLADSQGWVLGETLERAVKALQDALGVKNERIGEAQKPGSL